LRTPLLSGPAVQLGLRSGLTLGAIGLMHVWFSTMTPMPRATWGLMQSFYGVATIFFAGWAGLKAYAATRQLPQAAIAGGVASALGIGLFTVALMVFAYVWTDRLTQFPFAAEDLTASGKSIGEYLRSDQGFRDLWTASVASLLQMLPMAAGFGAVGGLVARSVDDMKEPEK
jgi:preprotein translocase subunit SecY